ncbi:hypothetical protein, partial [Paenibacillus barengoltzii]|uniref:hypothetical protein n=1 Tax=Paenibacillus barengoltzii TaxID=343517 RepID=UPI002FD87C4A
CVRCRRQGLHREASCPRGATTNPPGGGKASLRRFFASANGPRCRYLRVISSHVNVTDSDALI